MNIPKSFPFFISIAMFLFTLNSCKHKEPKELYSSFQIPETKDTFHYKVSEVIRRLPDFSQNLRIYKFKASYFGKNKELFYPNFFSEDLINNIIDNSLVKIDNNKRQLLKIYNLKHYKYVPYEYNENINNNSISIVLGKHIKKDSVYEVFIFNCSNEKKAIGYRSNINLLLEIKLFDCIWFALNESPSSDCGQSNNLLLNEKEICLTYLPELKKGSFKTEFRLRLGDAYSESYPVSIDESILQNLKNQN